MSFSDDKSIDFVLPWVDGSDPAWAQEFEAYTKNLSGDKKKCRYRDWDILRYIFRGFEYFTPWVRRIYFVTWGHLPPWLETSHDKLRIIKHRDFLDNSTLPIFSCNPIEINLHRIHGISERFVYFNDDTLMLKPLKKNYFFSNGLPCDAMAFNAIYDSPIAHIKINDIRVINDNFAKFEVIRRNLLKMFNIHSDFIEIFKTMLLLPWPKMTGFYDPHQPQPFLKSTFEEVWEMAPSVLQQTSAAKIRSSADVNQYLFRYWQLCQGKFHPRSFCRTFSKMIESEGDVAEFYKKITSGQYEMICINDNISDDIFFESARDSIEEAIKQILPIKSSFEL